MVYVLECVMLTKNARVCNIPYGLIKNIGFIRYLDSQSATRIIFHPQNFQVMSGMDERQQRALAS